MRHAHAFVVRHPRQAHYFQICKGRGGCTESCPEHARDDRQRDSSRDESARRIRFWTVDAHLKFQYCFTSEHCRCVGHSKRAALPENIGRVRGLQWLPSLQFFLFCSQIYCRSKEDTRFVDPWASRLTKSQSRQAEMELNFCEDLSSRYTTDLGILWNRVGLL